MQNWSISLTKTHCESFSPLNHRFMQICDFVDAPNELIEFASLQKFAKITPQYPGIRAALPDHAFRQWMSELAPMLDATFGTAKKGWQGQAWFSLVTTPPSALIPMQRLPHVDGTDPRQIAMMLYLHETDHGGTGFFRHRSTGLESLTDDNFAQYRAGLEEDVRKSGLPDSAYVTNGAPHFERIHVTSGAFNQAVFYRGNILHSGMINKDSDLSPDPKTGRLTINAFFRPIEE